MHSTNVASLPKSGTVAPTIVTQLKSPYKDGTTHIVMEPLEFMERLTALVPRPRLHLMADCRRAFYHPLDCDTRKRTELDQL